MAKRRGRSRRGTRLSPQGALLGLILLLVVGFSLLDFLSKRKGEQEQEQVKKTEKVVEVKKVETGEGVQPEAEEPEAEIEKVLTELKEKEKGEAKEKESVPPPPRIAIIIDDLGYSMRAARPIFDIKYPLTLSILPGLRYSLSLAKKASQPPLEATLHLPLEPEVGGHLEKGTIMVGMSEETVRDLVGKHLEPLLPYIKGVNSHMGSKATADAGLMKIVLEEVKKRGLYFVDSYTTDKSVAMEVAKSLGLRTASRQVFLDSGRERGNPDYIRGQMKELAELARKEGKVIAICHPKPVTLQVLKEMMPELAKEGIQFVTASEVVE